MLSGSSTFWRPLMRLAMQMAVDSACPPSYWGTLVTSVSSSSASMLLYSTKVWYLPWSAQLSAP